jgi:hypothetical protein
LRAASFMLGECEGVGFSDAGVECVSFDAMKRGWR